MNQYGAHKTIDGFLYYELLVITELCWYAAFLLMLNFTKG